MGAPVVDWSTPMFSVSRSSAGAIVSGPSAGEVRVTRGRPAPLKPMSKTRQSTSSVIIRAATTSVTCTGGAHRQVWPVPGAEAAGPQSPVVAAS
jgi:hypothetical protein